MPPPSRARTDASGATRPPAAGVLPKTGAGAAGFDFTKSRMNGTLTAPAPPANAAATIATEWACTKDNTTNLIWSLETQSDTWANATTTLPAAINAASRCGFTDWRLPTRRELLSIVHNGTSQSVHRQRLFPRRNRSYYWSNDTYAPVPAYAWFVGFDGGYADADGKSDNTLLGSCVADSDLTL